MRELALEPMRRARRARLDVAAAELVIGQHALAGDQRVVDGDGGLASSMSILARRAARRAASRVSRDDGEQRLAVEQDFLFGEQRLVGEYRRDVVLAGNIGRGQHRDDAGRGARRRRGRASAARPPPCRPCRRRHAACPRARGCRRYRAPRRARAGARNRGDAACGRPPSPSPAGRRGLRLSIRRHGALPDGSARRRPRFRSARASRDWRRLRRDRRRSRACR